jgi:hypothetical protein
MLKMTCYEEFNVITRVENHATSPMGVDSPKATQNSLPIIRNRKTKEFALIEKNQDYLSKK